MTSALGSSICVPMAVVSGPNISGCTIRELPRLVTEAVFNITSRVRSQATHWGLATLDEATDGPRDRRCYGIRALLGRSKVRALMREVSVTLCTAALLGASVAACVPIRSIAVSSNHGAAPAAPTTKAKPTTAPKSTPKPTPKPTPSPTPKPTPSPTPTPKPTPSPTPTPTPVPTTIAVPTTTTPRWQSGVYPGGTINLAAAKAFSDYVGRPLDNVHVFTDPSSWTQLATDSWETQQYIGYQGQLVIDMPLLPIAGSSTLAEVAAGTYDSDFSSMLHNLISLGRSNSVLVLGSEFNGDWQTYSAFDPVVYKAAFRRVAGLIRAASPNFRIDWTGNAIDNQSGHNPFLEEYPGDDVVDIIGVDAYAYAESQIDSLGFAHWANEPFGIQAWLNFAISRDKPFSVPEWGLTAADSTWGSPTALGSGDQPAYIQGMWNFFKANAAHMAFEDYFNEPAHRNRNSLEGPNEMPQSSLLYQKLWSTLPTPGSVG